MTAKRVRNAQVIAESLAIVCMECSSPQPNPDDGSEQWSPEQLAAHQGVRVCVACDARIRVVAVSTAQVQP